MIENEARYEAAIQRRIKQNARISRERRWLAAHADAQRLSNWLFSAGEFRVRCSCGNDHGYDTYADPAFNEETCHSVRHPAAVYGDFFAKMADSLAAWGGLSDAQTEVVRKGLQKALDRAAGIDAETNARKARDAASQHVGVEGQRGEFEAVVEFSSSYNTQFGVNYVVGLRDANGNILIIKGTRSMGVVKGQQVKFTAFVKGHGERDGVKQTILNRVKIKQVVGE